MQLYTLYAYMNLMHQNNPLATKPLSHQTAMPQRLYSVLKTCQRAVGSPRNMHKNINLPVIACTQRPHSVPTVSTRSHRVFTASMTLLSAQAVAAACSRRAQGSHGDFSLSFLLIYYFEQPYFANIVIYFQDGIR